MPMNPETWTLKTTEAIEQSLATARGLANPEVTPDHLLAAMLRQEDSVVLPVLNKIGVAPLALRNRADEAIDRLPKAYGGETRAGKDLSLVLDAADRIRVELGDDYLSTEHLLLALVDADEGRAEPRLEGVSRNEVLAAL